MKKLGEFFVYAAILLILAFGGCGFDLPLDTEDAAAADPTLSPPPAGTVWVKIPLPDDTARTLTAADNPIFINFYEVYFLRRAGTGVSEYLFSGSAKKGQQLVVSVVPDVTYDVLLLAGDSVTRTLLASAYGTYSIVSGQINQVDLALGYVVSDPGTSSDITFTYTDNNTPTYDGVSAANGFEVATITVNASGSGYAINDTLTLTPSVTGDGHLGTILVRVTEVESGGGVKAVKLVQGGRWVSAPIGAGGATGVSSLKVTGSGNNAATFDITYAQGVDIPANVPWLTYCSGASRTNPLAFKIKTDGLGNLIKAGSTTVAGVAAGGFALQRAQLVLDPLDTNVYKTYTSFTPVKSDVTTSIPIAGVAASLTDADTYIIVTHTLLAANLPEKQFVTDTYGMLYYELTYQAFTNKGGKWFIRNGLDITGIDKGVRTRGGGILVKIGNPGPFVGMVDVNVNH